MSHRTSRSAQILFLLAVGQLACSSEPSSKNSELAEPGAMPSTPEQGSGGANSPKEGNTAAGGDDSASNRLTWKKANLTYYTSYPDPGSEECIEYNGCKWSGWFAGLGDRQTPEWVEANNIVAVHEKDFAALKLKTLRLRQGRKEIDVVVYDMCADSDCNGCCTANSKETGYLIDIESFSRDRFGTGEGIVEWACLDCD